MNAWRLLKPGGVLVYSTCSFTRGQNEDVVAAFLLGERGKDADVEWIEDTADARFSVLRRQCDEDDDDHRSEDDTTSERLDPELVATYGEDVVAPIYACIAKNRLRVHGYYHVDGDSDGDNDDPQLDANRFWMSGLFIVKLRKKQPVFLECDSR